MLSETLSNMVANLAVAMVMLFSGLQLWWAVEALQQAHRMEAAGDQPALSLAAYSGEVRYR